MKNVNRQIRVIIIGCFILCSVSAISAQDWPQWRGVNRDGKVTAFKAPQKWPAELTKKWTVSHDLHHFFSDLSWHVFRLFLLHF